MSYYKSKFYGGQFIKWLFYMENFKSCLICKTVPTINKILTIMHGLLLSDDGIRFFLKISQEKHFSIAQKYALIRTHIISVYEIYAFSCFRCLLLSCYVEKKVFSHWFSYPLTSGKMAIVSSHPVSRSSSCLSISNFSFTQQRGNTYICMYTFLFSKNFRMCMQKEYNWALFRWVHRSVDFLAGNRQKLCLACMTFKSIHKRKCTSTVYTEVERESYTYKKVPRSLRNNFFQYNLWSVKFVRKCLYYREREVYRSL